MIVRDEAKRYEAWRRERAAAPVIIAQLVAKLPHAPTLELRRQALGQAG